MSEDEEERGEEKEEDETQLAELLFGPGVVFNPRKDTLKK